MDEAPNHADTGFMALRVLILAAFAAAPAAASGVCVENGSGTRWVFVADADDGPRRVEDLEPGETLCSPGGQEGTVAVFAARDDLEGCSRRVPAGTTERLLAFPHVDLCAWERAD